MAYTLESADCIFEHLEHRHSAPEKGEGPPSDEVHLPLFEVSITQKTGNVFFNFQLEIF